ncbi:Autoinducer synthetase [Rhodobacteraceae bacterium THAF1]|uniref:acyl-homoserine-lactone synthase n=1 Tax=Palleronia sp. THAF1 TaxID=2587842 RepID=UPI000F408E8B|nr:acyl-homoserine-lactone synthase [Palleronia sp. THAF1]QFU10051.1 Autoinducer synthetase [Palleronia sp. THAF1]VDC17044.1 Autoinducer synthetase [Rhodobacteraceae bacterium THAF1]
MPQTITGATFGFRDFATHGGSYSQFLQLRKRFFVDTLSWSIPHDHDMEMDQYDNPTALYSVAMIGGRVIGGARIMRYDARWGQTGCMMADAARGALADIPPTAIPAGRDFADAAEITRLLLCESLVSAAEREEALATVVAGLVACAVTLNAAEMVALTVPAFTRSLRKLGYGNVSQIGDRWRSAQDGRSYAVLQVPVEHETVETARRVSV